MQLSVCLPSSFLSCLIEDLVVLRNANGKRRQLNYTKAVFLCCMSKQCFYIPLIYFDVVEESSDLVTQGNE
jgi:hypothetical protein